MRFWVLFLSLLVMAGCASPPKPTMGFTGSVVVNDFNLKKVVNGNPLVMTDEFAGKMQSSLSQNIIQRLPSDYQVKVVDKCGKDTLSINGEFVKIDTDTDIKVNYFLIFLSHRQQILKAEMRGEITDCETGKVVSRFSRDTKDADFKVLMSALAETVVDEFEYISRPYGKGKK